ncbi:phage major capsid protein [Deinococcus rubellus]|uniref:Phage major capsid protein n=1 Tax=Deinococcus rubellus TaxID=1889240 RepID=A0ABY5YGG3_9DEIO|nr:phage major capsid protein [Deinococcus rubellus]UWX64190.1 phage major capsid protein [Deinococcus rubellus]
MPLTKEELAQMRAAITEEVDTLKTSHKKEADDLRAQLKTAEDARSAAEAQSRRPALYGSEGHATVRSVETKEDRRQHVIQRIGNFTRGLAAARGDLRSAAEFVEKRYGDKGTADALTRALSEGVAGDGGNLVETQYAGDMIELLYAMAVVRQSGARVIPLPNGNLTIHRQASGVSGAYAGELQNIPAQQPTTDTVTMQAKKLSVIVPVSNELLHDTSGRVNELIVADIGQGLSLREDLAFLRGTGDSGLSPIGVLNQAAAGNIATYTTLASAIAGVRAKLRGANLPMRSVGWIFNSDVEAQYYNVLSTTGEYIYRDEMDNGKLLGFPFRISNQIPSNLTTAGGTAGTEIYFADWSEVMIGEALALQMETSREGSYFNGTANVNAFGTDQTLFRAITRHDLALRHTRAVAVGRVDLTTVTAR